MPVFIKNNFINTNNIFIYKLNFNAVHYTKVLLFC